ncbi:MAG: hypothetical protein Q9217_000891 [Psora testacea]
MKSLALENLNQAVRDSHWATQKHNALVLNEAFQGGSPVYLIFSANGSGCYFGYARMLGSICSENNGRWLSDKNSERGSNGLPQSFPTSLPPPSGDSAHQATDIQPQQYALILPQIEATPSTRAAPPGCIVRDHHRGTVFWEADDPDLEQRYEAISNLPNKDIASREEDAVTNSRQGDLDYPFPISWQSTTSVPFQSTRGLRNPWNRNLEIKVAKDGQELEPSVGLRLLKMFR